MAEILYTRGPITVGGTFGANAQGFNIILRLTPEEQWGMTLLCPPGQQVDLAVVFTTVDFETRQVQYSGDQLSITYIGGADTRTKDVAARCKQVVEEKLGQAMD